MIKIYYQDGSTLETVNRNNSNKAFTIKWFQDTNKLAYKAKLSQAVKIDFNPDTRPKNVYLFVDWDNTGLLQ